MSEKKEDKGESERGREKDRAKEHLFDKVCVPFAQLPVLG